MVSVSCSVSKLVAVAALVTCMVFGCSDRPALHQDGAPPAGDMTAHQDLNGPDLAVPDARSPDTMAPDMTVPDMMMPDMMMPDMTVPDMMMPDTMAPDTMAPDTMAPDMMMPDTMAPDMTVPDMTVPDIMMPDMMMPDMMMPDMMMPDMMAPDFPLPDQTPPDLKPPPAAKSCKELRAKGQTTSGVYKLDPCGAGTPGDYYCDMSLKSGGWTVGGWQTANAKTTLGISTWGTVGGSAWSRDLKCLPYSEIMVFNKTHGEAYSQAYTASTWKSATVNMSIGPAAKAFRQGTYGPSSSRITMGCVDYVYGPTTNLAWACDSDSKKGPKGHLADYAGEYCPGGRLDISKKWWTWSDGSTCKHLGTPYTWGFAIR